MIDYVKILVKNPDIQRLSNNPLLDFKREVSENTGLLSTKTVCRYHHCEIRIYDTGRVIFSGSIHKMYNSLTGVLPPNHKDVKEYKGFNGNQLYYHEIESIREHLIRMFGVPSENMIFKNIEYGLNLTTSFDPQDFIRWLLLFEMKPFEFRYNEFFAQSVHSQYILKIYNKGNQYKLDRHTLRFEMKVTTMEHQQGDVGIHSLADINKSKMTWAFNYLQKQLKKLLYYDKTIDKSALTQRQKIKLKDYCNVRYWQELNDKERSRNKKRLNQIIELQSKNLRLELIELIEQNWVEFDRLFENHKWVEFEPSNIVSNHALLPQRICPITGLGLEHEKPGSKYSKTTTLKLLRKQDKTKFAEVCSLLLSNTSGMRPKHERDIIAHLAKQVRNRYYNAFKIKKSGYNRKLFKNALQIGLFPKEI